MALESRIQVGIRYRLDGEVYSTAYLYDGWTSSVECSAIGSEVRVSLALAATETGIADLRFQVARSKHELPALAEPIKYAVSEATVDGKPGLRLRYWARSVVGGRPFRSDIEWSAVTDELIAAPRPVSTISYADFAGWHDALKQFLARIAALKQR